MILGNPKATRLSEQVIVVILELTEQDWKEYLLPKVVHLSGAPAAPVLPMLAKGLAEKGGDFGAIIIPNREPDGILLRGIVIVRIGVARVVFVTGHCREFL